MSTEQKPLNHLRLVVRPAGRFNNSRSSRRDPNVVGVNKTMCGADVTAYDCEPKDFTQSNGAIDIASLDQWVRCPACRERFVKSALS